MIIANQFSRLGCFGIRIQCSDFAGEMFKDCAKRFHRMKKFKIQLGEINSTKRQILYSNLDDCQCKLRISDILQELIYIQYDNTSPFDCDMQIMSYIEHGNPRTFRKSHRRCRSRKPSTSIFQNPSDDDSRLQNRPRASFSS